VTVVTQYLLAIYGEYDVPIHPEQTRQLRAGLSEPGERLTDAGAFVFESSLLPVEPATAAGLSDEKAS
jgi:hypothetical protein